MNIVQKSLLVIFLIFISISNTHILGFTTIEDAVLYAQQHDEYPLPDNQDLLTPNYGSYYKKNSPHFLSSLAQKFGLKRKPLWTATDFKQRLESLTIQREHNGYQGRFVEKITPPSGSTLITFGDIFGAFHSLVRDMQELVKLNIINNQFKIIKENTFIIFNGNVIDLSPYILETFTLVLDLMQANPNRVFYLKGQHEDKEFWYNFGLKQELELRASHLSSEKIPLASLVNRFFNTLPLALYLMASTEKTKEVIRISPHGRKNQELSEENFGNFFYETKNPDLYKLAHKEISSSPPSVKAIIKSKDDLSAYPVTKGLSLLEPDQEATAWSVFSSPTKTSRTLYEFFFDAFAIIHTYENLDAWTITLFSQDVRTITGFNQQTFNLINPEQTNKPISTPGETPATSDSAQPTHTNEEEYITIGTSLDLSKTLRVESKQTEVGLTLAIEHINKRGGIRGKKLKLIILDDESSPEKARANIELLLHTYHTSIIISPMGSTPIQGFMDLIKEKKILVLFPSTGSTALRDPNLTNLIHFRPSYGAINSRMLRYAQEKFNAKKIAIVYDNDASATDINDQIKNAGLAQGAYITLAFDQKMSSLSQEVEAIKKFNPDTIVFFGSARNTEQVITTLGVPHLVSKNLMSIENNDPAFIKFLEDSGLRKQFIDTQNIPNPWRSKMPILKQYREDLNDAHKIDPYSAETYISTRVFIDALQRIEGDVTNESIVKILEATKNYNFEGFQLNFNPETRELSEHIWLDTGKPKWIKISVKNKNNNNHEEDDDQEDVANNTKKSTSEQENIVVGATFDLSKSLSIQGKETYFGMMKAIEKANREQRTNKPITLVALDDEGEGEKARKNVELLRSKYKTNIILSPLQLTEIQGFLDLVKKNEVLLLFPCTGSTTLQDPSITNLLTMRAWYADIDIASYLYAAKTWHPERVGYFLPNDEPENSFVEHLKSVNVSPEKYKIFFHDPMVVNYSTVKDAIIAYKPEVLILFSTIQASMELLRQLGAQVLINMKIMGGEFSEDIFREFIKTKGLKSQYVSIENFPNPEKSNLPIVVEYRKEIGTANPSAFSLEGYINASLFVELVRLTQGPITQESILTTAKGLKNYNFKGLTLTYQDRQLSKKLWMDTGQAEWEPIDINELIEWSKTHH